LPRARRDFDGGTFNLATVDEPVSETMAGGLIVIKPVNEADAASHS
jgi:oxalate decarboxylase